MKPCDCKSMADASKLNEQGINYNGRSLWINPPNVVLTIGSCELTIEAWTFERFAEWYLEDQSPDEG